MTGTRTVQKQVTVCFLVLIKFGKIRSKEEYLKSPWGFLDFFSQTNAKNVKKNTRYIWSIIVMAVIALESALYSTKEM